MLTESQILLLSNLVYKKAFHSGQYNDATVEDILKKVTNEEGQAMSSDEWDEIIRLVESDEKLKSLKVTNKYYEEHTGAKMVCFVDGEQAYAIFGGTGDNEWKDDFVAGTMADSPQQVKALKWIESLPYDNIIVSGHSKGGNKAMYVTVASAAKDPHKIKECFAFDGEGFSPQFCEKYKKQIEEKRNAMHLTSHYRDFVNVLLYPVAGDMKFIANDEGVGTFMEYHAPNSMFAFEDGKIVAKLAKTTNGDNDAVAGILNDFTVYLLENATEGENRLALGVLGEVFTMILARKKGKPRYDIMLEYGDNAFDIVSRYFTMFMLELSVKDPKKYQEVNDSLAAFITAVEKDGFLDKVIKNVGKGIKKGLDSITLGEPPIWVESLRNKLSKEMFGVEFDFESIINNAKMHYYTSLPEMFEIKLRDFSQSTKEIIINAAKETEEEKPWDFSKWDLWYKFEKAFGKLNWDEYTARVDDYFRKIIDINDASVKDIEIIFTNVYNIDSTYSGKMESHRACLETNVLNRLKRVNDSINPKKDK